MFNLRTGYSESSYNLAIESHVENNAQTHSTSILEENSSQHNNNHKVVDYVKDFFNYIGNCISRNHVQENSSETNLVGRINRSIENDNNLESTFTQMVQSPDALTFKDCDDIIIWCNENFKTGDDTNVFNCADKAFSILEQRYNHLRKSSNHNEADKLQPRFIELRKLVQEMNGDMKHLTERDLNNVRFMFSPSIERYYIDKEFGVRYFEADHSELLRRMDKCFDACMYESFGLSRRRMYVHYKNKQKQRCDFLHYKKHEDQIRYENNNLTGWEKFRGVKNNIEQRIADQTRQGQQFYNQINENYKRWNYDSFQFCDEAALIKNGRSLDYAQGRQGVILFYKKDCVILNDKIEEV